MSFQISKLELAKQTVQGSIEYILYMEFTSSEYELTVEGHGDIPEELSAEGVLSISVFINETEVEADQLPSIVEYEFSLGTLDFDEFEVEVEAQGRKKKVKSNRTKSSTAQEVHRPI